MKIIYYAAASLDGFIADANDGVEWLEKVHINQQATDYDSFFASVDGLLMGRKTFDFVYNYGQWPYEDKPTWVCTSRDLPLMPGCNLQSEREPIGAIAQARSRGMEILWVVGGGHLVSGLINAGLLTHLTVSVMPILLGQGKRLVELLPEPLYLWQENTKVMTGYTQIDYRIDKE